ncbi:MAG: hypothetical protein ACLPY5_13480 [Candidatus Bathyarchaeia archaeon]
MFRYSRLLLISIFLVSLSVQTVSAQSSSQLQITLIGSNTGQYYAPAGQNSSLMVEILNHGPGDIYLVRGETYLDPNLSGNWQLVHSESTDNFHLNYLQSAIWTFNLAMPSSILAVNATGGVPQVDLQLHIVYANAQGKQGTAIAEFSLNAPGAIMQQTNYSNWLILIAVTAIVVVSGVAYYRKIRKPRAVA